MSYFCCDERRRSAVAAHPTLNGIDFLEVSTAPADPAGTLFVHFIKDLAPNALALENVRLTGGERIRQIKLTKVTVAHKVYLWTKACDELQLQIEAGAREKKIKQAILKVMCSICFNLSNASTVPPRL